MEGEPKLSDAEAKTAFDREQWLAEHQLRAREIAFKEREVDLREEELSRSRWSSPLVVAILAATGAAFGNAVVAYLNGQEGQALENTRAESARILEMIKTGDADKAAENLRFLADAGLIETPARLAAIHHYIDARLPGHGTSLPALVAPPPTYDLPAFLPETDTTRVRAFEFETPPQEFKAGLRKWARVAPDKWEQLYPDGTKDFEYTIKRIHLNDCDGTVVGKNEEPDFQVFFPDKNCQTKQFMFRRLSQGTVWRSYVPITHME
jgi:hypothetical protein